jgi:hypothetical protein
VIAAGAFGIYRATVSLDNYAGNHQTQSKPTVLPNRCRVPLFKGIEDFRQNLRFDSNTNFGDVDDNAMGGWIVRTHRYGAAGPTKYLPADPSRRADALNLVAEIV